MLGEEESQLEVNIAIIWIQRNDVRIKASRVFTKIRWYIGNIILKYFIY